ncbi:MAG TPA: AAA family ATPase [Pyrinomonadaceae bacterium]|nr:AAA family ATPase [Pyrinomonadaceae bacterium]
MKLIIIHGPPAAGKLTVASELGNVTGAKVFHNHISIDCAKTVFEFGAPGFWQTVARVRFEVIAAAVREGIDLIHTFCYEFGADDEHIEELIAAAEDHGGEVHLVLLLCDDDERKRRIGNESRVKIGKLTDPASVGRAGDPINLTTPVPGRETLIIDTTDVTPEDSARQIAEHYRLHRVPPDLRQVGP